MGGDEARVRLCCRVQQVRCAGRVVIDMMRIIQQQDALRLYSLGEISMATLGQTFEVRQQLHINITLDQSDNMRHGKTTRRSLQHFTHTRGLRDDQALAPR